MKLRFLFGVLGVMLIGSLSFGVLQAKQAAAGAAAKSVWDGAFSQEQADRGAVAYKQNCSECHGQDLAGDGFAPALHGADFMGNWNDLSVGDLFERIRISMPPSGPSGVPVATKADIIAHILNTNKFPAGKAELEPKTEVLKAIKIEMKK